mmetsp:Transcript_48143/g.134420  ORF Transcript_48143/g.134420 Transcript_48143/m.134420 type:complete len:207 (+) Transcript_48143:1471-2091(+)
MVRVRVRSPASQSASHVDHSPHSETFAVQGSSPQGAVSKVVSSQALPPSVGATAIERPRCFCLTPSVHVLQADQSLNLQSTAFSVSQSVGHLRVSMTTPEQGFPHSLLRLRILLWREQTPVQSPPPHRVQSPNTQSSGTQSIHEGLSGHCSHITSRPTQKLCSATGKAPRANATHVVNATTVLPGEWYLISPRPGAKTLRGRPSSA